MNEENNNELETNNNIEEISKEKMIIEEYNINGKQYSIKYVKDKKAVDVFNALNRMIVSNQSFYSFDGVSIIGMFKAVIDIPIKKKWNKK